jgi:HNH endonuclease
MWPWPDVVDHVMPVAQAGTNERENLAPACVRCNNEKMDFTPEQWKEWRVSQGLSWPPPNMIDFIRQFSQQLSAEDGAALAALPRRVRSEMGTMHQKMFGQTHDQLLAADPARVALITRDFIRARSAAPAGDLVPQ